jgi:hypothetical protein
MPVSRIVVVGARIEKRCRAENATNCRTSDRCIHNDFAFDVVSVYGDVAFDVIAVNDDACFDVVAVNGDNLRP